MGIHLGLDDKACRHTADHLEKILADTFVLYVKTLHCHWNVVGRDFAELHAFFQAQYEGLATDVDEIAERIRTLGFKAPGSMKSFLHISHLKELDHDLDEVGMIKALLADREALVSHIRKDLDLIDEADAGTKALLEGLMAGHEKIAWMLRSHL